VRHFYTGHDFQAELGLYLTHYRAYEPALGRWLSADPIGEAGGINLYGYVSNNPVNWVDPLGLFNPSKGLSSLGNAANAGRLYARGALKLAGAAGLTATGAGAPVGAGAAALGGWNIWSGQSAWNRSMQQWNEALNEDWSDASWKNLLGVLPFGTEFDDPCEPSPWEVLKDKTKDFKDKPWEFMQEIGTWGF
jgi:type VI secretion system secreted protein VgrG